MSEPPVLETFSLEGRIAIVTGASSGLGNRFARALSSAGASLVLAARREEKVSALANELPRSLAVPLDLSREEASELLVEQTLDRFGQVDIVVNNAGITETIPALEEPAERFREVIETNLTAPYLLSRKAARAMIEQQNGGSIVNIASVNGILASRSGPEPSYAASKGGLVNLTRELANEWARYGIRVNAIGPGYFETEMTAELFSSEQGNSWVARNTPLRRAGAKHELDGAVVFLASDASSYVTGQLLCVDGGWTII